MCLYFSFAAASAREKMTDEVGEGFSRSMSSSSFGNLRVRCLEVRASARVYGFWRGAESVMLGVVRRMARGIARAEVTWGGVCLIPKVLPNKRLSCNTGWMVVHIS